jgi:RNA methyltransferase, TrmH family
MIESKDNPRFKKYQKLLEDKKFRYSEQCYLWEVNSPEKIEELPEVLEVITSDENYSAKYPTTYLLPKLLKTLSTTDSPVKYLVRLPLKINSEMPAKGKYVLLDNIQDPGNVGTIIRTVAALKYDGVIISSGTTDPFAPKTVRSSAGYIAQVKIYQLTAAKLKERMLLGTDSKGEDIRLFSPPEDFIICFSNEGHGLSAEIEELLSKKIAIRIDIDSLNVATAAGIILYQLQRSLA